MKATGEVDKDGLLNKSIRESVEADKATLSTLKTNLDLLGTVGDSKSVGDATDTQTKGTAANDGSLRNLYRALKEIVNIATTSAGVKPLEAGNITLNSGNQDGAKILPTTGNPDANSAGKAAAILASVSGNEMLASIVVSQENHVKAVGTASGTTIPLEFAMGGTNTELNKAEAKAAAVSRRDSITIVS
ncbi:Variable major outer membrane lipoprotein (plasmid) [Borrelia coriaceae ATCC 43381]|uniref:Variable large protein n=1 Tax=Borrelia coriaceae ATCC 43381 TaxID=1408429 RepID=W5SWK1_9SPIR|nr:Variable major outer membrane lipoprotein [Borrelia coriaceae ATCC 43381]